MASDPAHLERAGEKSDQQIDHACGAAAFLPSTAAGCRVSYHCTSQGHGQEERSMVPPKDHPSRLVGGRQRMTVNDSHSLTGIVKSYGRFVPQQFLRLLGKDSITEVSLGDHVERTMTVLFSDIRDFT
ncbi:MAG: hypothetical protein HN904_05765, partial [Victivallales bacterium]|nr:hypothetical protein [Victivallales bacterium]